jgi:hypothetical protein
MGFTSELRLGLFCALIGVVLGALVIGPLDALVALPAALAACAVVLAAAFVGRGLRPRVVRRPDAEDEPADHDGHDVAERHGTAGRHGED